MNYPYAPRLDSRLELTNGVYTASSGITSFALPYIDLTINYAVLSTDFALGARGAVLAATTNANGTVAYVAGNLAGGKKVMLGRGYTMSVELTRPYRHDAEGNAIISDRLQLLSTYVAHRDSGEYSVRVVMPRRVDRSKTFTEAVGLLEESGELRFFASGKAEEVRVFIENDQPRPSTATAVEFMVDVAGGVG